MDTIFMILTSGAIAAVLSITIAHGFKRFAEVKYGGVNDLARMKKELDRVSKAMDKVDRDDLRSRVQYLENKDGIGVFR